MFLLKITDREGTELKVGDIVQISDGQRWKFWAEVSWDEKTQTLHPFHTFSFHSLLKVDECPEGSTAVVTEDGQKYWHSHEGGKDDNAIKFSDYLMNWRKCERLLSTCFSIKLA